MNDKQNIKIIISGGGTGGHIFPAIAIADKIKQTNPNSEILFVGAKDRMEMQKVPENGYKIVGLPIKPLPRKLSLSIFSTLYNLFRSLILARRIIKDFKPDAVIGVGGYASFAVLRVAQKMKIPTLIQEQNSYAGISNKLITNRADAICVAYPSMEKFFPVEKIHFTGNPVRNLTTEMSKAQALEYFGLDPSKKTIFITGGSLGAKTINESILHNLKKFIDNNIQLIWQTGQNYYEAIKSQIEQQYLTNLSLNPFIKRMDLAFKAADLVISRAGALTISELALLGKPAILVPSPNVAEDHQTKNATALTNQTAALMIKDNEAVEKLVDLAIKTLNDENTLNSLSNNIAKFAKPNAADDIVLILNKIISKKYQKNLL